MVGDFEEAGDTEGGGTFLTQGSLQWIGVEVTGKKTDNCSVRLKYFKKQLLDSLGLQSDNGESRASGLVGIPLG